MKKYLFIQDLKLNLTLERVNELFLICCTKVEDSSTLKLHKVEDSSTSKVDEPSIK